MFHCWLRAVPANSTVRLNIATIRLPMLIKNLALAACIIALSIAPASSVSATEVTQDCPEDCEAKFVMVNTPGSKPPGIIFHVLMRSLKSGKGVMVQEEPGGPIVCRTCEDCRVSFYFLFNTPGKSVSYNNCGLLDNGTGNGGVLPGHLVRCCGFTEPISFEMGTLDPNFTGQCPPRCAHSAT